jgi:DNA polymerase-4
MEKHHRIIHIDMDAFFASVEQRDNPKLRGKPIAVGGQHRGVVAAASYEARKFGVRSAIPSHRAKKLCPQLIFVRGSYQSYKVASDKVMNILKSYTSKVQQVSIDEAYIDVTDYKPDQMTAKEIAIEIRKRIKKEVNLTASAGISFNKFLAKVASDCNKPDGYYVIHPNKADKFVAQLEVEKIPGVGKVNKEKLNSKGIFKGSDIIDKGKVYMALNFGKMGVYLHHQVTFKHFSPVVSKRLRKSIGRERTFADNIDDRHEMISKLHELSKKVAEDMEKKNVSGRTVTVKIKYHNFVIKTRSRTMNDYISSSGEIFDVASELLMIPNYPEEPVRLLGIQLSNLDNVKSSSMQLHLDF